MSPRARFGAAAAFAAALSLAASSALAELAVRITDLRPGEGSGVPNLDAAVFLDRLYFAGTASSSFDRDLWVYDGVSAPTMVPGGGQLQPQELTVWQGALWFEAGPFGDRELWRYDGVNPPVEALDILASGSGQPANLVAFGPELCFSAFPTAEGDQFVCWDGSTTPDVYELRTGGGAGPQAMTVIGSTLYFDAFADGVGSEPFAYDNFFPPVLVGDLNPGTGSSAPESFTQLGTTIHFDAADGAGQGRVWSDDGVSPPAQVSLLLDVEGGVVAWRQKLFAVGTLDEEEEIQGGVRQLHLLRDGEFEPVDEPAWDLVGAHGFLDHRNALYFRASGGSNSAGDLFRYCGAGGVERLTDQFADASYVSSAPILFQGRIYFSAYVDAFGQELWVIDPLEAVLCDGFETGDVGAWSSSTP